MENGLYWVAPGTESHKRSLGLSTDSDREEDKFELLSGMGQEEFAIEFPQGWEKEMNPG